MQEPELSFLLAVGDNDTGADIFLTLLGDISCGDPGEVGGPYCLVTGARTFVHTLSGCRPT